MSAIAIFKLSIKTFYPERDFDICSVEGGERNFSIQWLEILMVISKR